MAVNTRRLSSIESARARRLALPRYLRLDGARYLLGMVILLCLMSLIVLVQTGVVATRGYAISTLEAQKVSLLRERTRLQERQARAQSLERIRRRAEQIGMMPVQDRQIRYIELPAVAESTPVAPDTGSD
ncbi:MAG: hypothetical protein RMK84_13380 [Oscillochloridaceae bacterium]|nr:hypothetical protein [Chloroflexaceae bacterium]MDW8391112.1 hypothetical protein [Oscillochloridaceae bacterium]